MNSELRILKPDAYAFGGAAVGTLPDGKRCFVRNAVPGDVLAVRITADKKNFARAVLAEIKDPSPLRRNAECPYAAFCPGCSYQNTDYATELEWKRKQFERFLRNLADSRVFLPPVGASERFRWRNKIRLTVQKDRSAFQCGYLMDDNQSVLNISDCLLAKKEISALIAALKPESFPDGESKVTFRYTEHDGARITGSGGMLRDAIPGIGEFQVPETSFFQINTTAAGKLAEALVSVIVEQHPERVCELYCGCGVFSIAAAKAGVGQSVGIELDAEAVRAAELNRCEYGFDNLKFIQGNAGSLFPQIGLGKRDMIVIDPPRTGMAADMRSRLARTKAGTICYISCGPDTLARDAAELIRHGWKIISARMFDLFPSTAEFESMTVFQREE